MKDVNYEHMPPHWAPAQVWFAKRKKDYIGDVHTALHNARDNESPKQYNAEWILLSNFVVQIPVENIPQAVGGHSDPIDLNEVDTPPTPSIQDSDSPRAQGHMF